MSFASEVRSELGDHIGAAKHCQKAELAGIYEGCLRYLPGDDAISAKKDLLIYTESLTIQKKCINLVKKAYHKEVNVTHIDGHKVLCVQGLSVSELITQSVTDRQCCNKAYLRGWFLSAGTVTDPEGHYSLEIVTTEREKALHICEILGEFDIEAKTHSRRGYYVVYIREGQKVVDFLGLVGAYSALMKFENARILKEVRAGVNRQVNCETANIRKTISASARQIEDIEYIKDNYGLERLSDTLSEIAKLRLQFPESSLTELGSRLSVPIGKSGVNHRLRRLSEFADELRDGGR